MLKMSKCEMIGSLPNNEYDLRWWVSEAFWDCYEKSSVGSLEVCSPSSLHHLQYSLNQGEQWLKKSGPLSYTNWSNAYGQICRLDFNPTLISLLLTVLLWCCLWPRIPQLDRTDTMWTCCDRSMLTTFAGSTWRYRSATETMDGEFMRLIKFQTREVAVNTCLPFHNVMIHIRSLHEWLLGSLGGVITQAHEGDIFFCLWRSRDGFGSF